MYKRAKYNYIKEKELGNKTFNIAMVIIIKMVNSLEKNLIYG